MGKKEDVIGTWDIVETTTRSPEPGWVSSCRWTTPAAPQPALRVVAGGQRGG
jgi:hypothetical protein